MYKQGSAFKQHAVPSFSGCLSMMDTDTGIRSVVEYMATFTVSFNEKSSVQYIIETSLAASSEAVYII